MIPLHTWAVDTQARGLLPADVVYMESVVAVTGQGCDELGHQQSLERNIVNE